MSLGGNAGFVFLPPEPAPAVDMNEQRSGFLGLDLPKVERHVLVGTVGDVLVSRLDLLGDERREKKKGEEWGKEFGRHNFLSNRTLP